MTQPRKDNDIDAYVCDTKSECIEKLFKLWAKRKCTMINAVIIYNDSPDDLEYLDDEQWHGRFESGPDTANGKVPSRKYVGFLHVKKDSAWVGTEAAVMYEQHESNTVLALGWDYEYWSGNRYFGVKA